MTYFVTNVSDTQYTSVAITIRPTKEEEVDKATYDYLNTYFGASGRFTFRTSNKEIKKVKKLKSTRPKKVVEDKVVEDKVVEDKVVEDKVVEDKVETTK